jgi:RNase adaptor protein for sRNA GlmZ degradation
MKMLIISGLSGSGKSVALQALEDLNYYCVDNLPLGLLTEFVEQVIDPLATRRIDRVAVGIDARNLVSDLGRFGDILREIRERGVDCDVIFLTATDNVLIKRFSETRRKHPLTRPNVSLTEAIAEERELLAAISASADLYTNCVRSSASVSPSAADRACRYCSSRSASSTAFRPMPTMSSTCVACPTLTGIRSCGFIGAPTRRSSIFSSSSRG